MDPKISFELIFELLHILVNNTSGVVKSIVCRLETLIVVLERQFNAKTETKDNSDKEYFFSIKFGVYPVDCSKITMIKILRQHTNLGLKEAKEMVEECMADVDKWQYTWEYESNKISEEQAKDLCESMRAQVPAFRVRIYKTIGNY